MPPTLGAAGGADECTICTGPGWAAYRAAMGASYRQFCPVSKAMELLDERWTLLVVRELLLGSRHFNELRRGNPKMSPALLSKRLRTLERAGIVRRTETDGRSAYELTESGYELKPIVDALGAWGARWVGELGDEGGHLVELLDDVLDEAPSNVNSSTWPICVKNGTTVRRT